MVTDIYFRVEICIFHFLKFVPKIVEYFYNSRVLFKKNVENDRKRFMT